MSAGGLITLGHAPRWSL